jgi:HAE1 family hydrophobic/amphiphilic exporter-1
MFLSISDIFIKRPVLTTVCTILIVLFGAICIPVLPIEYIPQIAPIQVQVTATYTGADPATIEATVTTPIERKINTTQNMDYMTSQTIAGSTTIQVFFPVSTDQEADQVNVQNNLTQAVPLLPSQVQQQGVVTQTSSTSLLRVYGLYSPNGEYDGEFISNYEDLYINDEIARIAGVGQVAVFGQLQYAMRFWVDPNALQSRQLTINDVVSAIKSQNVVIGAGAIGQDPIPPGQQFQIPLKLDGMFKNIDQAKNLIIKVAPDGTLIKLKDVGRVELGAQNYGSYAKVNGKPGVGIGIYQFPGSNAMDIAKALDTKMEELEKSFPPGLKLVLSYDTVAFIQESSKEVLITLLEAICLVLLVVFIFLQDIRATIIPAVAIPVSLVGALIFAKALNFSLNSLTMLGLVLATGLVVDDGILVVEAIVAKMQNEGLSAKRASIEAMNELSGAVIATSLVLMAVFIPVAFFPGATGLLYRQFALIIAFSIGVSVFNALTFSPSMSAILLKPSSEMEGPLGWFFTKFNGAFASMVAKYKALVEFLIKIRYAVLAIFVAGLGATVFVFNAVPTGFVPAEDQGSFLGILQTQDRASVQKTQQLLEQVEQSVAKIPEVDSYITISGYGFNGNSPNQGIFFGHLTPWDERTKPDQNVFSILKSLNIALNKKIGSQALVAGFDPPPIPGFSPTGGFEMQLQDTTNGKITFQEFQANAHEILKKANQTPVFGGTAYTQFSANTPQYEINIDRDHLAALNVNFEDAMAVIGSSFGSIYVNQFVLGPRFYQVYVQLEGQYRNEPEDLKQIYVRSSDGQMISMDQLVTIKPFTGPAIISHFNEDRSILLQGVQNEKYSSGQAIDEIQAAFKDNALPGIKFSWADLTREEVAAGSLGALIFLLGIIMVFLILAAQYESYVDPVIILLTVPLAVLGALGAIMIRRTFDPMLDNDVYVNIALVMLVGLASKNAILIVEFANQAHSTGKTFFESALIAAEERIRPILMTAFAALVGFWPLVIATGAGANARHSLGTTVFGGLLVSTFLSLLVVPVLYVIIKNLEAKFLTNGKGKLPEGQTTTKSHQE